MAQALPRQPMLHDCGRRAIASQKGETGSVIQVFETQHSADRSPTAAKMQETI